MNLIIEYFIPENESRYQEYLSCLRHNLENSFIKRVHLFVSDDSELPEDIESDKIEMVNVKQRPTYTDFFNYCTKNLRDEICILSNADIMFDETLMHLTVDKVMGKFLALSRWDIDGNGGVRHFNLPYSQDCWIFVGGDCKIKSADFTMGVLGCDNRITYLASKHGLVVTNPSKLIVTKHLHLSGYRTYKQDNIIKGMYLFVDSNDTLQEPSDNIVVSPPNMQNVVRQIQNQRLRPATA